MKTSPRRPEGERERASQQLLTGLHTLMFWMVTGIQPRFRSVVQALPECVAYVDTCKMAVTMRYIHA